MNAYSVLTIACLAAALTAPSLALAADTGCGDKQFAVTVDVDAAVALSVSKPSNPSNVNVQYAASSETYCYTDGERVTISYPDLANGADLFDNPSNLFDSASWNTSVSYQVRENMHVVVTQDLFTASLSCTTDSGAACK